MLPPSTLLAGGARVLIDGSDRWVFPPADESAAGLAFLLMLFGCVCSMSLLLNNSIARAGLAGDGGHLFFLGPDGLPLNPNGGRGGEGGSRRGERGLRLLTMEEVETLPTVEYSREGSGGDVLEMRDKTDDPYAAEDELGGSLHPDASDGGGPSQPSAGGLGGPLLPSKDDDGGGSGREPTWARLHSTSCSICLDDYDPGEHVRVLPCGHTFHGDCIFPWLTERSPTCPLCKGEFSLVCSFSAAGSECSEAFWEACGRLHGVEERIFEFGMRFLRWFANTLNASSYFVSAPFFRFFSHVRGRRQRGR